MLQKARRLLRSLNRARERERTSAVPLPPLGLDAGLEAASLGARGGDPAVLTVYMWGDRNSLHLHNTQKNKGFLSSLYRQKRKTRAHRAERPWLCSAVAG